MNSGKLRALTLLSILFIAAALAVGSVNAVAPPDATYAVLTVTNDEGDTTINFDFGETVYVSWEADGAVDIEVHQGSIGGPVIDGVYDQLPTGSTEFTLAPGKYFIVGTGAQAANMVCMGSIFVAPESVLGALSAVGACFMAVGAVAVVKRKHN